MSNIQSHEVITATERIKLRLRRTAEDIVAIGQDLILIKQQLHHGQFLPWIESEFEMTDRTAVNFMRVAERFPKSEIISDLKPTVIYELAAPSTPPEVIEQVTAKAEQGESVSVAEVKELKKQLKEAQQEKQTQLSLIDRTQSDLAEQKQKAERAIHNLNSQIDKLNQHIDKISKAEPKVIEKEVVKEVVKEVLPAKYKTEQQALNELYNERQELNKQITEQRSILVNTQSSINQADAERKVMFLAQGVKSKVFKGIENAMPERNDLLSRQRICDNDLAMQCVDEIKTRLLALVSELSNAQVIPVEPSTQERTLVIDAVGGGYV